MKNRISNLNYHFFKRELATFKFLISMQINLLIDQIVVNLLNYLD